MFIQRLAILIAAFGTITTATAQLSVTLTGSMHNGSSIPCFGKKVGTITSTVSGGVAPYTYDWSNSETTPNITGISAGFYSVDVKDANGTVEKAVITLTEPEELKVTATVSSYTNGHSISCFECSNGYILVLATQGTAPYSYAWSDGPSTAQNRYGLGPKAYKVTVSDANGCETSASVNITQPERSDWTMEGNAGTNPNTQYIGTSDDKDVVFKANGLESVRLKANGSISLLGNLITSGPLTRMPSGELRVGDPDDWPTAPEAPCTYLRERRYWRTSGNDFTGLCPDEQPKLGTLSSDALKFITNGIERMRIATNGSVVIGSTTTPATKLHVQGDVSIANGTNGDLITSSSATTGPVLWARNGLAAWGLSIDPEGKGHILGDWNNPHPVMNFAYDQVEIPHQLLIGDVQPRPGYRLFVQDGLLAEKVKVAIKTTTDWSDHVFQPGYRLMPLEDIAAFIGANKHLPGVPSAQEMVKSGLDVAQTDAILLEKIEEITLHMIEMKRELKAVKKENARLKQIVANKKH